MYNRRGPSGIAVGTARGSHQSCGYGKSGEKQRYSQTTQAHFHGVNSFPIWDYSVIMYLAKPIWRGAPG
jgi:ribosomal protein L15